MHTWYDHRLRAILAIGLVSVSAISTAIGMAEPESLRYSRAEDIPEKLEALLTGERTALEPDLPDIARAIVEAYDEDAALIRRRAAEEIRDRRSAAIVKLKTIQDTHTRSAQLDPAVAIRNTIRHMREVSFPAIENPGSMHAYAKQIGKSFLVRVVGRINGSVYGSDYYTYDSDLATACVHSGVLRVGETGIVIVSMVQEAEPHLGISRNSVKSHDYGVYPASYRIKRWKPVEE